MEDKIITLIQHLEEARDNAYRMEDEVNTDSDLNYWIGRRHSYEGIISMLKNIK